MGAWICDKELGWGHGFVIRNWDGGMGWGYGFVIRSWDAWKGVPQKRPIIKDIEPWDINCF